MRCQITRCENEAQFAHVMMVHQEPKKDGPGPLVVVRVHLCKDHNADVVEKAERVEMKS